MDQMDRVLPYLAELGALHQRHGVAKQHIDLLGLAFCAAIRGVVQVTGQLGYSCTICGYLPGYNKYVCAGRGCEGRAPARDHQGVDHPGPGEDNGTYVSR